MLSGVRTKASQAQTVVCLCAATVHAIPVMWLHAIPHGRLFIFLNFDLAGVITCHARSVVLSRHCYSCDFPIWNGGKKAFPSTQWSYWRQRETDFSKHRERYKETGGVKKKGRYWGTSNKTSVELPHPVCGLHSLRVIWVLFIPVLCNSV